MRRVRRKGGSKDKVFGRDLLEHLNASCQEIPQVLRWCSEFVEQKGIVDGIYRLSGVSSNIQKLRGEFESDGRPDLHKDVYLQDIHCVSSLCKAYFRELPNPLLTYQLYDKFAEAVSIQLEEERLVKIRDVLKELPAPHYRTLEFLMHHLVRMASFSSETNMHARNLAIVWAPNLLRSKDIETSGFNGTAAFMEVRVQSIVVEFILTHVPQLFPEPGVSSQRRKSLPSPSAMFSQSDAPLKSVATHAHFGNISPGDGPIPIRPYHAIIEGTDRRMGSLKGRKWMSIFNIGGRFHDQRKRHKNSAKEKNQTTLRPARSMDSLSHSSYPNEASRGPAQQPLNVKPAAPQSSETLVSPGAVGGSKYAVTYRRGTGLVSGSVSTNAAPDPEGAAATDTLQSTSPGLSNKAGRRAAMHITGPTMVTVPLHITSNLALGVLQGGGGDRVVHCSREKARGERRKQGGEKPRRKEHGDTEKKGEGAAHVEEEKKEAENIKPTERTAGTGGEARDKEERDTSQSETNIGAQSSSTEQQVQSLASNNEEHQPLDSDVKDSRGLKAEQTDLSQLRLSADFNTSDVLNSTIVDDGELCDYIQDNFEFLDQMDCRVLDHMDPSLSSQVIEFSVEPPCHSDEEYLSEEQPHPLSENEKPSQSLMEAKPVRPKSLDLHNRHTKSLTLPLVSSPVHGRDISESSEEEEEEESVSEDSDVSSSDDDDCMFVKSLPSDFFLNTQPECEMDSQHQVISANVEVKEWEDGDHVGREEELKDADEQRKSRSSVTDEQSELNPTSEATAADSAESPSRGSRTCSEETTNTDPTVEEIKEATPESKTQDLSTEHEEISVKENSKNTENTDAAEREQNEDEIDKSRNTSVGGISETKPGEENSSTCSDTWDELEEIICEVIEDCESEAAGREEEKRLNLTVSGETTGEDCKPVMRKAEVDVPLEEEGPITEEGFIEETEKSDERFIDEQSLNSGQPDPDRLEESFKHPENKEITEPGGDDLHLPVQHAAEHTALKVRESSDSERGDPTVRGLGSKLVVFKHPKVYQVKAVPVVPPKPQYCKLTPMTLRQQQAQQKQQEQQHQQEQQKLGDLPSELDEVSSGDAAASVDESFEKRERAARRAAGKEREQRWDGAEGAVKETSRNSPLSMCFDEAVAIATMRREKERREVEVEMKDRESDKTHFVFY